MPHFIIFRHYKREILLYHRHICDHDKREAHTLAHTHKSQRMTLCHGFMTDWNTKVVYKAKDLNFSYITGSDLSFFINKCLIKNVSFYFEWVFFFFILLIIANLLRLINYWWFFIFRTTLLLLLLLVFFKWIICI